MARKRGGRQYFPLNSMACRFRLMAPRLDFTSWAILPRKEFASSCRLACSAGVATFVINNQGTVYRGFVRVVVSQPDIFTSTNDAGGDAVICNVTDPVASGMGCIMGPFKVTSPVDSSGTLGPTVLDLWVTGVRFALPAETKVSFVNGTTTTDIVPTSVRRNTNKFGFDLITIVLPPSLAGTAPIDYKLIVTVTKASGTFTSRPAATAPQVTIIP